MRRRNEVYIALFALSLAAALLFVVTDRNTVSQLENRTLNGFPGFSIEAFLSGSFQDQLEDALGDHMPFSESIRGAVRSAGAGILRL